MADRPTEARHPASEGLHARAELEVLGQLLGAQQAALEAVQLALPAIRDMAALAAAALGAGGRMVYVGSGSSGLMALADCLELAGTFGIAPDRTPMLFPGGAAALMHMTGAPEDDPALGAADAARIGFGAGDAVICVSASGSTPYTVAVAQAARAAGARVLALANVPGSALLADADVAACLDTGPEVVSGSTRMAAATAQKAALNLLSVLVGIRLGHVHDGYMVNVVADNAKLVDRAARIVAGLSGGDVTRARAALAATGGAVKPAVLVARGADPEAARAALDRGAGHLARALNALHL